MNRRNLCRDFAAQTNKQGKASALYYSGRVMYSYGPHFPLAVITGDREATVNSDRYSQTTSCHAGAVRGALAIAGYKLVEADTRTMQRLADTVERDA